MFESAANIYESIFDTNTYKYKQIIKWGSVAKNYGKMYDDNVVSHLSKMLANFDINTVDKDGKNLLHHFADKDHKLLKILLDHGININQPDNLGQTPLFYTTPSSFEFFMDNGADLLWRNKQGHSVLHKISNSFFTRDPLHLIEVGKKRGINLIDYSEYSPEEILHRAIVFRDREKMKMILEEDTSYSNKLIEDNYFHTRLFGIKLSPLYVACYNTLHEEVELLVEYGADPRDPLLLWRLISRSCQKTPAFMRIIQRLVDLGADIHEKNILHECYRSAKLMEIFLKAGCDIRKRTDPGNQYYHWFKGHCLADAEPLHYCAYLFQEIRVLELLFEYGADPNVQNMYGVSPFMSLLNSSGIACFSPMDIREAVQLFLDRGANIHLTDNRGNTIFHYLYDNDYLSTDKKALIVRIIREKEKFFVLEPRTNEIVYKLLGTTV